MSAKRAAALQAWVDVMKHARDEEAAVRRLLARLLRCKLSMGVDAWCRAVVKMRDEKKLDAARAAAVRKVLVTLLVKSEARGLRQWRNALRMQHWEHTLAAKQAELESHKKELESRKQDLEYHKQELDSHKQELDALAVKHASAATTHAAAHEERQSEVKAAKEKERRAREDLCRNSYGHHHEHAGRRGNGQAVVGTVADPRHSHH
jgi:septal ring factor EnvC (AmiA/AmiB activator)